MKSLKNCFSTIAASAAWLLVLTAIALPAARAQYQVVYAFNGGSDGSHPNDTPFIMGGTLYGTTLFDSGPADAGNVFSLDLTTYQETILHSFEGGPNDGAGPTAKLIGVSNQNGVFLFGTTASGGPGDQGTVFVAGPTTYSMLHTFSQLTGSAPYTGLTMDPNGFMYGTTLLGGPGDLGTAYKMNGAGIVKVIHYFGKGHSAGPESGFLVLKGRLYGTSGSGLYSMNPKTGAVTSLYTFTGGADGYEPSGNVITDGVGNLYGTTERGGSGIQQNGNGVVYKFNLATRTLTVLHTFTGADGSMPLSEVVRDASGNLYGTTYSGGDYGNGTVFRIDSANNFTTLHSFASGADGAGPYGGLAADSLGNYYGMTAFGGVGAGCAVAGCGVIYKVTP